eukprot:967772_1
MDINIDIEATHMAFMSKINQILFNPMCMARPIGAEDLRGITQIYMSLLKPQNEGRFYDECGVKLEALIVAVCGRCTADRRRGELTLCNIFCCVFFLLLLILSDITQVRNPSG